MTRGKPTNSRGRGRGTSSLPPKKPPDRQQSQNKEKLSKKRAASDSASPAKARKIPSTQDNNALAVINSTFEPMDSDIEGIISPGSSQANIHLSEPTANKSQPVNIAKVNLQQHADSSNFPVTTRKVFINSTSDPICYLSKINPLKIANEIDRLCCEPVADVQGKSSGSLLITTANLQQVETLLKINTFLDQPVKVTIAWSSQTSQGKIYAPEFINDSLEQLLEYLKPSNVISIRKLFQDPNRKNAPLYVLTFLSPNRPEKIKVGYSQYCVDPYYPSPTRCNNCCRWGHSTKVCNNSKTCNHCSKKGHSKLSCTETLPCCINCKGPHEATSKLCPVYLKELSICKISIDNNISLKEARSLSNKSTPPSQTPNRLTNSPPILPNIYSQADFPSLTIPDTIPPDLPNLNNSQQPLASAATLLQSQAFSTQESTWLTPGQAVRDTPRPAPREHGSPLPPIDDSFYRDEFLANDFQPLLNNLQPSISPLPSTNSQFTTKSNNYSCNNSPFITMNDFTSLLTKLVPILIKLFFSNEITERISCFMEMGTLLKSENLISELLNKFAPSSLNNNHG